MEKIDWSLDLERWTCSPGKIWWVNEWFTFPKSRKRPAVFRVPEMAMKQQEWRYLFWVEGFGYSERTNTGAQSSVFS